MSTTNPEGGHAHDPMMTALVLGSSDVVGLLAYAIYSQFRDEWKGEFRKAFGREPSREEHAIFEIGEQTARRQMTYRFLADARVMGQYRTGDRTAKDAFVQTIYVRSVQNVKIGRKLKAQSMKRWLAVLAFCAALTTYAIVKSPPREMLITMGDPPPTQHVR